MKMRRMLLRARWLARLQNQEADDLTNMEFRHFDPKKRIEVDMKKLGLNLMESLLQVGDEYLAELDKARALEKLKVEAKRARGGQPDVSKGKKQNGLKDTDPW